MFPTSSVKMASLCHKRSIIKIFLRSYCKSKPPEILPAIEQVTKKTNLSEECVKITTEKSEECVKFEERAIKQILVEKEQDAHLQSSVSKECNRYFIASQKTLASNKCGVIHLENITLQKGKLSKINFFRNLIHTYKQAFFVNEGRPLVTL